MKNTLIIKYGPMIISNHLYDGEIPKIGDRISITQKEIESILEKLISKIRIKDDSNYITNTNDKRKMLMSKHGIFELNGEIFFTNNYIKERIFDIRDNSVQLIIDKKI